MSTDALHTADIVDTADNLAYRLRWRLPISVNCSRTTKVIGLYHDGAVRATVGTTNDGGQTTSTWSQTNELSTAREVSIALEWVRTLEGDFGGSGSIVSVTTIGTRQYLVVKELN